MNRILRILTLALSLVLGLGAIAAPKRSQLVTRIVNSEYALEEIMAKKETAIPASTLQQAKGIIITLNYRGGFMFGIQGGRGVLVVKNPRTGQWGVPAFVSTAGKSMWSRRLQNAAPAGVQVGHLLSPGAAGRVTPADSRCGR